MKNQFTVLFFIPALLLSVNTASAQQDTQKSILTFYCQQTEYTDPGEFAYLFENLPESIDELCDLIKCQLVHPADLPYYSGIFPSDRQWEDEQYPGVKEILAGLLEYDSRGLVADRKPVDRLLISCRYHSILLASILRYRNIPVRLRWGFAPYIAPGSGYSIHHAICEVWNEQEQRWMFVDPDRNMVDFHREKFELGGDIWLKYQQGEIDPRKYGGGGIWGEEQILDMFIHDLPSVLGYEATYWEYPSLMENGELDINNLEPEQIEILNIVAIQLQNPDENFNELKSVYQQHLYLQYEYILSGINEYKLYK